MQFQSQDKGGSDDPTWIKLDSLGIIHSSSRIVQAVTCGPRIRFSREVRQSAGLKCFSYLGANEHLSFKDINVKVRGRYID